jgi:hypothetical protein
MLIPIAFVLILLGLLRYPEWALATLKLCLVPICLCGLMLFTSGHAARQSALCFCMMLFSALALLSFTVVGGAAFGALALRGIWLLIFPRPYTRPVATLRKDVDS